ncbi:MAG: glycosyltransferase [Anaerolineaceae bacterium]|nr:glycosyltransferase [Anaerolineaceae bacterium]
MNKIFIKRKKSQKEFCQICGNEKFHYLFVIHNSIISQCSGCGVLVSNIPKSTNNSPLLIEDFDPSTIWTNSETEYKAVNRYFDLLEERIGNSSGKLLIIAPKNHITESIAIKRGFSDVQSYTFHDYIHLKQLNNFDAAIIIYQLEKINNYSTLLKFIWESLNPGGCLLTVVPNIDSRSANFFGKNWHEWRPENKVYFNSKTLQLIFWKSGFSKLLIEKDIRRYTLAHVLERGRTFPRTFLTKLLSFFEKTIPSFLRESKIYLPTSGMIITGVKQPKIFTPICSIILPVYNEKSTFLTLIDSLIKKEVTNVQKEIIIIESNSNDGTREHVLKYKDYPRIKIVLQDVAKGKGNAVREGLKIATGDIILIQDADLEYDINDYDALIEPIVQFRTPFVLGARHGGNWKMRQFDDQKSVASMMNLGHLFFTNLMNILYNQKMKDPFTMYKVFRQDCIFGLDFECNRFDFDNELVIKLIKKGYTPLEIPVNYQSRSFREGKKVDIFRDPISWLWINLKLKFTPVFMNKKGWKKID